MTAAGEQRPRNGRVMFIMGYQFNYVIIDTHVPFN